MFFASKWGSELRDDLPAAQFRIWGVIFPEGRAQITPAHFLLQ
jgi:hypothetical protein